MTQAEIMEVFENCKDIGQFKDKCDWFLNFLKENGIKHTFDSFQTLVIFTDESPALKIPLHQQGRRRKLKCN
jgi:hypothetical protein